MSFGQDPFSTVNAYRAESQAAKDLRRVLWVVVPIVGGIITYGLYLVWRFFL